MTNGDKRVAEVLDQQLSAGDPCPGDPKDREGLVHVDFTMLLPQPGEQAGNTNQMLKDLLEVPSRTGERVLHHPVIQLFVETRWLRTRWMFCTSSILYLLFLLTFSSFLGLTYFRWYTISLSISSYLSLG